jgi:hypothetical protein
MNCKATTDAQDLSLVLFLFFKVSLFQCVKRKAKDRSHHARYILSAAVGKGTEIT